MKLKKSFVYCHCRFFAWIWRTLRSMILFSRWVRSEIASIIPFTHLLTYNCSSQLLRAIRTHTFPRGEYLYKSLEIESLPLTSVIVRSIKVDSICVFYFLILYLRLPQIPASVEFASSEFSWLSKGTQLWV